MPAPRTCRTCGTPLSPDVRWCGLCKDPVREFAPRGPVHTGDFVGSVRPDARYSRWRSSPTAFGPAGRLLATLAVIMFGPWGAISTFTLLYTPVWILLSVVALRHIWQRQRLDVDAPPTWTERLRGRPPGLATRVEPGSNGAGRQSS